MQRVGERKRAEKASGALLGLFMRKVPRCADFRQEKKESGRKGAECRTAEATLQYEVFMSALEGKLRGIKHCRDLMNFC